MKFWRTYRVGSLTLMVKVTKIIDTVSVHVLGTNGLPVERFAVTIDKNGNGSTESPFCEVENFRVIKIHQEVCNKNES